MTKTVSKTYPKRNFNGRDSFRGFHEIRKCIECAVRILTTRFQTSFEIHVNIVLMSSEPFVLRSIIYVEMVS